MTSQAQRDILSTFMSDVLVKFANVSGQQLAGELGRTMQPGSTLAITTQAPGALQAFGEYQKTFKDVSINGNILTAIRQ